MNSAPSLTYINMMNRKVTLTWSRRALDPGVFSSKLFILTGRQSPGSFFSDDGLIIIIHKSQLFFPIVYFILNNEFQGFSQKDLNEWENWQRAKHKARLRGTNWFARVTENRDEKERSDKGRTNVVERHWAGTWRSV